jgi:DNA-binding NarL/FixJ family response regulator
MEAITILVADDNAPFRDGMRALLRAETDLGIVGEAGTGEETISQAATLQPDVILMDLQMPSPNGIEATRRILAVSPHMSVLVLTMFEDDDSVFAALQAGARGYLLKGAPKAEIVRAIRAVSQGEAIFGPSIAKRVMSYFSTLAQQTAQTTTTSPAPAEAFPELTDREREILTLVSQHLTNSEIAERLVLSPKTVRNHVSNIFSKLQVATRSQAIILARDAGLA